MHISEVRLTAFKRFTDLTIQGIPQEAKLVVLAGPNGIGKSTVFDGLNAWRRTKSVLAHPTDATYFAKVGANPVPWQQYVSVIFHETQPTDRNDILRSIWVRSAYRHEAEFVLQNLSKQTPLLEDAGVDRLIDTERSVAANYQRLIAATIASVYDDTLSSQSVGAVRARLVGKLQAELASVFEELTLEGPGDPLANGTFLFTKGMSENFRYLNLSAGEKAAFDLLLDLVLRVEEFDRTVFCIDEPELHIGTRTQRRLLESMLRVLPASCQLWLATHSIGMMRAARDLALQEPTSVSFIDMGGRDYDKTVVLTPAVPDRAFWKNVLTVALDDLAELVAPDTLVLCEGHPTDEWDARCLRKIFGPHHPSVEFVSVGNNHDVQGDRAEVGATVTTLVPGTEVIRVRDRDEMTADEVSDVVADGCRVLSRRHLESFLLADDVLHALADAFGRPDLGHELVAARNDAVADAVANRSKSPDDLKAVAGAVYNATKHRFTLTGSGSTAKAFLAEVVSPLLKPGMPSFDALENDIFGTAS